MQLHSELVLPKRIGLKPEPLHGEIKRRLFITPILGLPGRGRYQLSTVNCQLSTVNCQLNEWAIEKLTALLFLESRHKTKTLPNKEKGG
ncbi:hypothetical protein [Microcoleus sp. D2_18a_D3]|uniref:hypothetical protein n=1 Tax=Microcoleus sp. D2_18a_D3 TaxID=3055330 RepID=UPI002FD77A6B